MQVTLALHIYVHYVQLYVVVVDTHKCQVKIEFSHIRSYVHIHIIICI